MGARQWDERRRHLSLLLVSFSPIVFSLPLSPKFSDLIRSILLISSASREILFSFLVECLAPRTRSFNNGGTSNEIGTITTFFTPATMKHSSPLKSVLRPPLTRIKIGSGLVPLVSSLVSTSSSSSNSHLPSSGSVTLSFTLFAPPIAALPTIILHLSPPPLDCTV